jgi:anti-sigma factor RsiW
MNGYDCDSVRDLLPQHASGGLGTLDADRVRTHLAFCTECRAEAELVELIQSTLDPLPDGFEARVLAAVHQNAIRPVGAPSPATPRTRTVRQWPVPFALAATIAAAVVGGVVVLERAGARLTGNDTAFDSDAPGMSILSWAAADDAMLHGGTVLQELTVEELEQLLEELDS